jgi:ligand-binding SRPBCC domain-containing protein
MARCYRTGPLLSATVSERSPHTLRRTQVVPAPPDEAFALFASPYNLEAITPPWLRFRIVAAPAQLGRDAIIRYRLRLFGIPIRWLTQITAWEPPGEFVDTQTRGPFALWEHTHRLTATANGTEIADEVRYRLFLGPFGELVQRVVVRRWLDAIFDYRARAVDEWFAAKR